MKNELKNNTLKSYFFKKEIDKGSLQRRAHEPLAFP